MRCCAVDRCVAAPWTDALPRRERLRCSACTHTSPVNRPRTMTIVTQRLALILTVLLAGAAVRAADGPHNVWLLSTRESAPCSRFDNATGAVRYWRLNADCTWSPADAKDFHAGDKLAARTVVFVHGNHTDANEAVEKGWHIYQTIRSEAAGKPFRYVIWSWPADRVCRRHRSDAQLKATYVEAESYYFGVWLRGIRPGSQISLVGHSFGPRIITGALHLMAGGELAGQKLPPIAASAQNAAKRTSIRAVLLAAALDADCLAPDGCNGRALSLLDRALITCNGCDRVLKWYSRLYGRGGPEAMGFVGPCGIDDAENVTVMDVSGAVGRTHDYERCCSAISESGQWARYTFLDDAPAKK
jgi:hypothetical protein